jgi:hypothetical protein
MNMLVERNSERRVAGLSCPQVSQGRRRAAADAERHPQGKNLAGQVGLSLPCLGKPAEYQVHSDSPLSVAEPGIWELVD